MNNKEEIMSKCIQLAFNGKGYTKTNPLVGAAVIKNGSAIYGIHEEYGKAHAEVNAIKNAGEQVAGSELFVTLEPCSTYGKTPPCVEKIINSNIKKVYVGILDVNSAHAGKGINILKNAGIEVEYGIMAEECSLLIEDFIKFHTYKLPYVTLKTAISLDGRIATHLNHSQWITCEQSRNYVHKMRGETDVVLTGIGTILADDPLMTYRGEKKYSQPVRVILDSSLKIPLDAKIINSVDISPVIIYASEKADIKKIELLKSKNIQVLKVPLENNMLDLHSVLSSLYDLGYMNVMVESGSKINGSFFDKGLVDKLEIFIAPKIIGGENAIPVIGGKGIDYMSEAKILNILNMETCGSDIHITAKINDYTKSVIEFTKNYIA